MNVKNGLIPRYYQLKEILERRLLSAEFQPGDQFPTDENLCSKYGLSRGTVRRAVDMLVEEGRLCREQGRGTFVTAPPHVPMFFRLASFDEEMRQRGRVPSTRLLELKIIPAPEKIAADLLLSPGEDVIEITRLRLADGQPMAYETRYMAYKMCPELIHEDLENQSIHDLLIDKYNIPLIRARHTIEAHPLTEQQIELLHAPPGSAGFFVNRITYTLHDCPVTLYQIVYRGDEYRFSAEF
jgi:GntR family transcriptional regulator